MDSTCHSAKPPPISRWTTEASSTRRQTRTGLREVRLSLRRDLGTACSNTMDDRTRKQTTFVSTERVFSVPPDKIFAAFEQPDQLARWWGPKDFTNTFEQFEFTPG